MIFEEGASRRYVEQKQWNQDFGNCNLDVFDLKLQMLVRIEFQVSQIYEFGF